MARKLVVEILGDARSYERALGRSTNANEGRQAEMRAPERARISFVP
jgi:hypothetical protein